MTGLLRSLPRTVWLLGAISLVNDTASDMIYPLVPLYLASVLMAGPKALGLIEGVAEALSSLLKLAAGVLADRSQRARHWVIGGYTMASLARPLIGLTTSWFGVFLCRLADRAGKGLRTAPRDALLSASVAPAQRGAAFGLHRAMDNLGAVVGPLLAAGLLAAGMSLRHVFLFAIVPGVLVIVMTLVIREPDRVPTAGRTDFSWRLSALPATFRRYLVVLGLFTLGNSSNMFLLLRARELGMSEEQVPILWALVALVAALFGTHLSAWSDRIGRQRLIAAGWGVYAGFYLLFGLMPAEPWLLWPMFAGYGIFLAATEGAEKAMVADLTPADRSGTAYGWYNLVVGMSLLPASLIFGLLWSDIAPLAAFAFGSACALLAAVLLVFWVRPGDVATPVPAAT